MKFLSSRQKGFTLVEIIVSIAIFIVVAIVALGALLRIIDSNQKSQGLKTSINNMNFALESMSRELRVGSSYYCLTGLDEDPVNAFAETSITTTQPCDSVGSITPAWVIAFNSTKTAPNGAGTCRLIYAYFYNGLSLYKAEQSACATTLTFYPIIYNPAISGDVNTDQSSINFSTGRIRVVTKDPGNPSVILQPYVQLFFSGSSGVKEKNRTTFDYQTTISQRIID